MLILSSCGFSNQHKAESLVKKYMDSTLNDPKSYEPVSFSKLQAFYGKQELLHKYRAKNEFGAVITKSEWFQFDSLFTKAFCCYAGPNNN